MKSVKSIYLASLGKQVFGVCHISEIQCSFEPPKQRMGEFEMQFNRREGRFMIKESIKILAVVSVIVLLQLSCASLPIWQESNELSIAVEELVKTTRSWDGKLLRSIRRVSPRLPFDESSYLREPGSTLTVIQ